MSAKAIKTRRNGDVEHVARLLERNGIEGGVQRLNKTLERRIIERTAQLEAANEQLEKEIIERKRMEGTLRNLALKDDLTGLYNRRGFLALAEQQLKLALRMEIGLSLVYADLDGLKRINDTFGHDEGDAVLRKTAEILSDTFRDSDIIARLGGDEFTALVMNTSDAGPKTIAIRLQQKLADYNAQRAHSYELSLSVGIAYLDPRRALSIEQLIAIADERMYERKRSREGAFASG